MLSIISNFLSPKTTVYLLFIRIAIPFRYIPCQICTKNNNKNLGMVLNVLLNK